VSALSIHPLSSHSWRGSCSAFHNRWALIAHGSLLIKIVLWHSDSSPARTATRPTQPACGAPLLSHVMHIGPVHRSRWPVDHEEVLS
jgi:hypothetical protein